MSVLIRGMEMPKDGDVLTVKKDDDGKTYIKQSHTWGYSAELIELPPHGRLIDADVLMENAEYKGTHDIVTAWDIVNAQTVIEAEVGDT